MRIQKNFFLIQVTSGNESDTFEDSEFKKLKRSHLSDQFKPWTNPPMTMYLHPSATGHTNGFVWWTEQSTVTGDVQTHLSGTCETPCELNKPLEKGIFKNPYLHRFHARELVSLPFSFSSPVP